MAAANPIRELRETLGVSQDRLALVSGVDRPNVSLIENGHRVPKPATLDALKKALLELAIEQERKSQSVQSVLAGDSRCLQIVR